MASWNFWGMVWEHRQIHHLDLRLFRCILPAYLALLWMACLSAIVFWVSRVISIEARFSEQLVVLAKVPRHQTRHSRFLRCFP